MRLSQSLAVVLLHVSAAAGESRPSRGPPPQPQSFLHRLDGCVGSALDEHRRLREDVVAAQPHLKTNMLHNANGRCEAFMIEPEMEHFLSDTTLEDVATFSLIALSGNVVHVARGFFHGFPGTVVGFRVTDKLAVRSGGESVRVERGDLRYTFIAAAEIVTPEGAICSKTPRPVTIPRPGDAILMFAYVPPSDAAELIVPVDTSRHLVIERSGKRIFTPANLADDLRELTIPEAMLRAAEVAERPRSER